MVKQVDAVKYVGDTSVNLNLSLYTARDNILESAKVYDEKNLTAIHATVQQIADRLDKFTKTKQVNTFREI